MSNAEKTSSAENARTERPAGEVPFGDDLSTDEPNLEFDFLGRTLTDLESIGRMWANHGLRIGVAALQTSAMTLTNVAMNLSRLSEVLYERETQDPDPQA